jgi:predicted nucleic acid-binding protein
LLYLDTSVLLAWTLTQSAEPNRGAATKAFMARLKAGALSGATSFYALHEVYLFAIENAPDFPTGAAFGKSALEQILSQPLRILPFVSRVERGLHARKFRALRDLSDLPHALVAYVYQCEAIVTYDSHFRAVAHVIPCKRPEDYLAR